MMARYLVTVCMLSMFSVNGFGQEEGFDPGSQTEPVSEKIKRQLSDLLPDERNLGLQPDSPIAFYGDNLYEYIDGAAGAFEDYDFVALVHRYYKRGDAVITIDIYDMGEKLNAFGIYTAESSPNMHPVEIGALGHLEKGIVNFFQARYYIKLSAFSENDSNRASILKDVANNISHRIKIKGGKRLPEVLRLLPSSKQVLQSCTYTKRDPLGFAFLSPSIAAKYQYGDVRTTVLCSLAKSPAKAREHINRLREQIAKNGTVRYESAIGKGAFSGEDAYRGRILGFAYESIAVILLHPPKRREELVSEIQRSIRDYFKGDSPVDERAGRVSDSATGEGEVTPRNATSLFFAEQGH